MLRQWQKLFLLCVAAWGVLTAPLSAQGIVQQRRVPIIGMPGLAEKLEQLLPIFSTEVGTVDGLRFSAEELQVVTVNGVVCNSREPAKFLAEQLAVSQWRFGVALSIQRGRARAHSTFVRRGYSSVVIFPTEHPLWCELHTGVQLRATQELQDALRRERVLGALPEVVMVEFLQLQYPDPATKQGRAKAFLAGIGYLITRSDPTRDVAHAEARQAMD